MYPLLERARRTRIFQLCASFLDKPIDKHLLEVLPTDIAVPLHGPTFMKVQQQYQRNMHGVAEHLSGSRVPLLLTTVPSNLRDLSPMSSLRNESLTVEQQRQQAERTRRVIEKFSYGEFELALPIIRSGRELEPENALLAYREAQCLENLQRRKEAGNMYVQAADLDGCRSAELQKRSSLPAPGNDFFLEHVHYNIDGHWAVALILGQFIQSTILKGDWDPQKIPDGMRRDELLGLTPLDHLMGDSFALLAIQAWPLKLAPDSKAQISLVTERLKKRYASLAPIDQRLFADLSTAAMQQDLLFLMGCGYQSAGELDKAVRMFEMNMVRRPWDARGFERAAAILQLQGKAQQAAAILARKPQHERTAEPRQ
jgi:tetratricopeptide (TPR) repeat protein